jgi:Tfp pilus assembly protein PilX
MKAINFLSGKQRSARSQRGVALVATLLLMMLLSALALSLTMVTSTEERIADSYLRGTETFYLADAALELAVHELSLVADWSRVLDGSATPSFVDGRISAGGWPGGLARTSSDATALVTCGRVVCTTSDLDARTADRPWGANNPRWQLFAYGPARDLSAAGTVDSAGYLAVWVGDDSSENDGKPLVDGDEEGGPNPGRGVLSLLVHAYGPSTRRVVEATVARAGAGVRVISWREIR